MGPGGQLCEQLRTSRSCFPPPRHTLPRFPVSLAGQAAQGQVFTKVLCPGRHSAKWETLENARVSPEAAVKKYLLKVDGKRN